MFYGGGGGGASAVMTTASGSHAVFSAPDSRICMHVSSQSVKGKQERRQGAVGRERKRAGGRGNSSSSGKHTRTHINNTKFDMYTDS